MNTKDIGESALPAAMPWDSIRPAIKPELDPIKPFLKQLQSKHDQRTAHDPDFLFTRASIDLSKQLMAETTVSLNETKRRAQQADIEAKQLKLENDRRQAKGEEPLKELAKEDEDALPAEEDKSKPEDDAYLSESGHILIDYLGLNPSLALH
jgi:carboxyl-terminal processing protease